LVSLKEEEILELPLCQLVTFVQLSLLHLPDGSLARSHQLLLLLKELPIEQSDLFAVSVVQTTQRRLVSLVQFRQK
jgi:hypothetical protein